MTVELNATHDPGRRSWVESANAPGHDFPIQNLPFGVFRRDAGDARLGVAIGDAVLDLRLVAERGLLDCLGASVVESCRAPVLNPLMAAGAATWSALRARLGELLAVGAVERPDEDALASAAHVAMLLPAAIGDYTDFYASLHHATHVGSMFRPDHPLLPNYKWVPVGYHGRASSVVPSGTPVRRPVGQRKDDDAPAPTVGPSRRLDYELEVGFWIGPGNPQGVPVAMAGAAGQIFGVSLVNDWSARDIQRWEYQPLGPFLSKSFATTVSPWVVTAEALAPFRVPACSRAPGDPAPLPYLHDAGDQEAGGLDLTLEVHLHTEAMRTAGLAPHRLSRGAFREMYWTPAQLVTHHASNGCPLRPGDLLASGTVSGAGPAEQGCLLELAWQGTRPVTLPSGETRRFLEDGDEVIIRGRAERPGYVSIGFGDCRGRILG